jgi:ATPase family associated with various cellular activities (AAA)
MYQPPTNGNGDEPLEESTNSARIRAELAVLDAFLEHAVKQRAADPRKRSLNPFQGVILESEDILARFSDNKIPDAIDPQIEQAISGPEAEIRAEAPGGSRLGYLATTLRLRRFEERCLILALAPELDSKYSEIYAYLQDNVSRSRPSIDLAMQLFSTDSGDRLSFSAGAPLIRSRLLLEREPYESLLPMSQRTLSLDDRVLGFLLESPEIDYGIETWVNLVPVPKLPPRVPMDRANIDKTAAMARECYAGGKAERRPIFHLLGRTGTGRRALAEVVCRESGAPLLAADMCAGGWARDKADSFWRLGRESLLHNAAILIENFDDLLEEEAEAALAALFQTIHDFSAPMVFLCGSREWRPPQVSSATPFVSVPCPSPSAHQRIAFWNYHLGTNHQLSDTDVAALAGSFDFTDGQIRDVVALARSMASWEGTSEADLGLGTVRTACRKHALPNVGNLAQRVERTQGWDSLKLPAAQMKQLREIAAHLKHSAEVFGEWGFAQEFQYGLGLAACFEGPSGTGKTMAAGILAAEVGQELIRTDLSAIQSKYIGETNKHLNRLFDEAQTANAILFIDEADALFGKRSEVKDSHDRYANSEVAFLLQKIEDYRGTVILATNMKQNMDEAFLRRLRFVIHFPFPDDSMRLAIWKDIFPKDAPADPNLDFAWLARRLKIAGGNIKNIAIRAAFLAADRPLTHEPRTIDMSCIIEAAQREYEKLGRAYVPEEFEGWRKPLEKAA